ncbi:lysophospholipid acyltransferase family protein [Tropicimonas marinistellae]|uniref:lysophospholipid acyltransferase family protein n=1 Tax=Tropicimonas marinistellae TaxID=1739787 RepID=UPI00082FFAA1|nr:hypothetical protein [Tropicimonas marinistellae]
MADTTRTDMQIHGTRAERVQDSILHAALWSARRLPYARRVPMFGALARASATVAPGFRRRILENLDYVWPEMTDDRRRDIAAQSLDNFGRALIEHFSMSEVAARMADVPPVGPGVEQLQALQSSGKPAIILTGHFGNHEAVWICLLSQGLRTGGFYRPMSNPYTNARYVAAAQFPGVGPLFSQDRAGMGRLLRHLKGGGNVLMLNDLYVGSGVEMEFLGRPAMTSLSAAELSLRMDAPMFPAFATRQPDGLTFRVDIEAPIPPGDAESMTAAFNRSIAARIEDDPGQWYWIHRRWKRKWNRGKGMEGDPHPAALPRRKAK